MMRTLAPFVFVALLAGNAAADPISSPGFWPYGANTQGSVIYHDAGAWKQLGPGTSGNVLTTNGAGANPSWNAPAAAATIKQVVSSGGTITQAQATVAYYPCSGLLASSTAGETTANQLWALGGTFKNLYASVSAAPGTGNSVIFRLRINGATPSGGPTCTVSDSATSCNDLSHTAPVTAGQTCDVQVTTSTTLTGSVRAYSAQEFDPS
jgi:hypothetical protein